ncbi:MAG: Lrp/AsnC family transcriptional regulator [Candidatus Aminicenantaceae bacterium]
MGKRSGVKKDKLTNLLLEYLKDSNRSDRQMAKILGVSQPTVSRMKSKLLEEGLVRHFSAIPDFAKMGYEIMAFSFVKFNMDQVMEIEENAKEWAQSHLLLIRKVRRVSINIYGLKEKENSKSLQRGKIILCSSYISELDFIVQFCPAPVTLGQTLIFICNYKCH